MTEAERFWAKVDKSGECWLWRGAVSSSGYGTFRGNGKHSTRAHRMAWTLVRGAIPVGNGFHGTCVCHRCDVRLCVNPAHLFLGSNAQNMADRDAKGRQRSPLGEKHGRAVLSDREAADIRASTASLRVEARRHGVHATTIMRIRNGTIRAAISALESEASR